MPTIKTEIKHNLEKSEAIQRIKDNCVWARGFSDLNETWSDNVMEFSASIQGVKISGRIEVTRDAIKAESKVPLIALPFKSWLPNILRHALKPRKTIDKVTQHLPDTTLLLYLHIPKAGGTTLGEFIYNQCCRNEDNDEGLIKNGVFFMPDGFFRENATTFSIKLQDLLRRKDLRAVVGHFTFGIHNFVERPFHYITLLREPVSRVISLYHYLKLEDKMSLEQFALSSLYREVENDQTRRIAGVNPKQGKCNEADLKLAKENLRRHFIVVGTTERLDETMVLLKEKLCWTKAVSSYPRNVNSSKRNEGFYSQKAIQTIYDRNQLDLELYRYTSQLMDEMIAVQGEAFIEKLKQQKELNTI